MVVANVWINDRYLKSNSLIDMIKYTNDLPSWKEFSTTCMLVSNAEFDKNDSNQRQSIISSDWLVLSFIYSFKKKRKNEKIHYNLDYF